VHWILHVLGVDNVSGPWYGFWSGFGSDLGEVTIIAGLLAIYKRHNCHVKGCLRIGRHPFTDDATGATYMLCGKHHPAVPAAAPPAEAIGAIHARNEEAR
jgi:hypothetical protein